MNRRDFVRLLGAGAVVGCPLCRTAAAAETAKDPHAPTPDAGHAPAPGGGHWGDLAPEFRACGAGTQQSPLNFDHHRPTLRRAASCGWTARASTCCSSTSTIPASTR